MLGRLTITVVLIVVAAVVGCARSGPTLPQPAEVLEFEIPWPNAFPSDVVVDARGRVWFTDRMAQVIGRFDPQTREFDRFELPTARSAPYGFVRGPDGAFWYAAAVAGRLGRVDPETGEITEVELEGVGEGGPHLLAVQGSEVWFTARGAQMYGRYEPATGRLKIYSAPERFGPYGIATSKGRVWILSYDGGRLLEVDGGTERARAHEVSRQASGGLALRPATPHESLSPREPLPWLHLGARRMAGADGVLWISGFGTSRVFRIDPRTAEVDDYPSLFTPSYPYGIAVASDGIIWYSEKGNDAIVALEPRTRRRITFRVPSGATVRHLAVDVERGRVWLPLSDAGKLGLIDLGSLDGERRVGARGGGEGKGDSG